MSANCLNCEYFRYTVTPDANVVFCDLIFDYNQVTMEQFVKTFEDNTACENWEETQPETTHYLE
jgi:hypothetical protein